MLSDSLLESMFESDREFIEPASQWKMPDHSELGSQAERFILNFLMDMSFEFVAVNHRERPFGEVDLIVKKNAMHYFIEVKARRSSLSEELLEGIVRPRQYMRLFHAAELYSARNDVSVQICLALLSIQDEGMKTRLSLRFLPLS